MNQTILVRSINDEIKSSLQFLLNKVTHEIKTPDQWAAFYDLIRIAYLAKREERPSVSQLSQIFKKHGIQKHGKLAVIYAHALYVLALHEGTLIYGEGFNP